MECGRYQHGAAESLTDGLLHDSPVFDEPVAGLAVFSHTNIHNKARHMPGLVV